MVVPLRIRACLVLDASQATLTYQVMCLGVVREPELRASMIQKQAMLRPLVNIR
jgi:hypothetical protein